MIKNALSLLFVWISTPAWSAPIPLTSSTTFKNATRGSYFSNIGFSLNSGNTGWTQTKPPKSNSYIEALYLPSEDVNIQASLTVRSDIMEKKLNLEQYAKRWLKDYPRFGFDILTAKKVRVGEHIGYMLDLISRENSKQLRQVLFVKGQHAVTLTCRDDLKSFSKTLKSCNEIIRTFRW